MLEHVGILLVALSVLVWSADKFVLGASSLAKNLGVSPMIIGLTIVAMGSSAPEMMVAAAASIQGSPDTAIGNAIGSNIINIALVLGFTVLIKPLVVSSTTIKQELPLLLVITVLAYWIFSDDYFSFAEGIGLMIGFICFISVLLFRAIRQRKNSPIDDPMLLEVLSRLELGDEVPKQLYLAVAKIIAFAYYLQGKHPDNNPKSPQDKALLTHVKNNLNEKALEK